jgi:hypothetical protein
MPVVEKNWNNLQVITIRYLQRGLEICGDSLLPRRIRTSIGIEGEPKTDGIDTGEIFLSLAQFPMKEFGLELPPDDKPTGTPTWLVIEPSNMPVGIRRCSRVPELAERLVLRERNSGG